MVSEGVQTNGFNNGNGSAHPNYSIPPPPLATATATSPIRTVPPMEYTSPGTDLIDNMKSQVQVLHILRCYC